MVKVAGGGTVVELGPEVEGRHEPEPHEAWQDSVVLFWWDLANAVGGYHRIGHHPFHPDGPQVHLSNNFFSEGCVYKRCGFIPLRDEDKLPSGGFGCGDGTCTFEYPDHAVWRFDQEEVSGELHVRDFHPPVDIYPKTGQLAKRITAGHLEVGGSVSGELTLNGNRYEIDGLAFRDHGWGKRYWEDFVAHRWVAGTFGPDLTVLAVSVLGTDDEIFDFGCLIRDDELTYSDDVRIVPYMEHDALTHDGGHVTMRLADGETVELECEVLQKGVVSWMADVVTTTDTLCRIRWGDRVGICNFEMSNNPGRGRFNPRLATMGFTEDGLHILDGGGEAPASA